MLCHAIRRIARYVESVDIEKWLADQDWAQVETVGWLRKSLAVDVPGPDDPGTAEMVGAISRSLAATQGDIEKIGALLMQLTLSGRVLVHAFAEATGQEPAQALDRLMMGPPSQGYTIGGSPRDG
jgi:predicted amino acid-binding ACT domain protein